MHAPAALGHGLVFITVPEADQMHDRILRASLAVGSSPTPDLLQRRARHECRTGRPMRGSPLVDRLQRAGIERDVGLGAFAALEDQRDNRQQPRRPQVPLSRLDHRAMPPAGAAVAPVQLAPIRRPPPWRAAKPRRGCAPSPCSPADRETPRHSHRGGHPLRNRNSSFVLDVPRSSSTPSTSW